MSGKLKPIVATLTLAVCGLTIHHVTRNANAIHPRIMAATFPDIAKTSSSSVVSERTSVSPAQAETDDFKHLQGHLKSARAAAEVLPGYTAILELQEEVNGSLRPVDRIEFKTRREPFSVYMRWNDSGQEALYVHGENDNRLIVKPTKGLAAIRRVWRLEPDSPMAKQNCRYPITDVGIENLVRRIQEFYSQRDDWSALAVFGSAESTLAGREVTVFDVKFKDENAVPEYCSSKFCFDNQTQLLVAVENYGWSNHEIPTLIERYVYHQITETPQPEDADFAEENPAYQFVAK